MTIPKSPVSSFGPELMQLLLRGSVEEVTVVLPTYTSARHLQSRIHSLRAAMRREKHSQLTLVERCRVSLQWGERGGFEATEDIKKPNGVVIPRDRTTPARLYLRPQDLEYRKAIEAAGIALAPKAPSEASKPLDEVEWIDRLIDSSVAPAGGRK